MVLTKNALIYMEDIFNQRTKRTTFCVSSHKLENKKKGRKRGLLFEKLTCRHCELHVT